MKHKVVVKTEERMTDTRQLRKDAGLTQFEAARAARIDRTRLALAETSQISLSDKEACRLRKALLLEIRKRRDRLNALLADVSTDSKGATDLVEASA